MVCGGAASSGRLSLSSILLFDLKKPFFRPDPSVCRSAARKICQGRRESAAQRALSLTD